MSADVSDGRPADPRDVFLRGKHVILRALTEDDVHHSGWYGWFNDEESCLLTQHHRFPNSRALQLEYFRNEILNAQGKLQLGICAAVGEQLVGVASLQDIDHLNGTAQLAIMIGEKAHRNVSCFVEAFRLMIRHGFNNLNLRRIYDGTMSPQLAELCCRSLGFRKEGVHRQHIYKNGRYYDVYLIGLLKDEFIDDGQPPSATALSDDAGAVR